MGVLTLICACSAYDADLLQPRLSVRPPPGQQDGGRDLDSGLDSGLDAQIARPDADGDAGEDSSTPPLVCAAGVADCNRDGVDCETAIDTLTDCGGCDVPCRDLPNAVATCESGTCGVAQCESGYDDCDGEPANGCETALATLTDCGGCGVPCDQAACAGGICSSIDCSEMPLFADCDGDGADCETDLGSDIEHCGSCDAPCELNDGVTPNGALGCGASGCEIACDDDFLDCDGDYRTGCEAPATDTDDDGTPDCMESCETDPDKTEPGQCGCGTSDSDADEDGTADCNDGCPQDPTRQSSCFGFTTSNFDPSSINWSIQPSATLDCGTTTIDTSDPDGSGSGVATLSNWCGSAPTPRAYDQPSGSEVVLIPLRALTVSSGATLRIVGSRPVIFAVDGDVEIDGVVDASASGTTPGAGGNQSCGSSRGGNGTGSTVRWPANGAGASGGGGGGFGTTGGRGGTADTDGNGGGPRSGGDGGTTRGNSSLQPLIGGCAGGRAGGCSTDGGGGGGAVQITASSSIVVDGSVRANGSDGATPCGANDEGGGTGGGSGGAVLLEAPSIEAPGSNLQANGGRGGRNGAYAGIYNCGGTNGGAGSSNSSSGGQNGSGCQGGGSGGGGGYGRIRTIER